MARPLRLGGAALLIAGLVAALWLWQRSSSESVEQPNQGGRLTASLRSEPANYNRYIEPTAAADYLSLLTDGRLVRLNRATDTIEPALAESWTQSSDGLTYTFALRRDVRFSDGVPFTSADVEFTAKVLYDAHVNSSLGGATRVAGEPLAFAAPDPYTVRVTLPSRFAPGIRLLDNLPILPRHKLEQAFNDKRLTEAWRVGVPLSELAGLGPFMLTEHTAGQRLVFSRNPHYWRRDAQNVPLPYLDNLVIAVVLDQNSEALRMETGEIDLMANSDIRSEDYASLKRASDAGRLHLLDVGVSLDPNLLWFNLSKTLRPEAAFFRERRFRQAISHAVNRQAIADSVFLGAAVPIFGPTTPGNRTWYSPSLPQQPYDPARANELLDAIGLKDRTGDGMREDNAGRPVRFSILTQKGNTVRERTTAVVQEHLKAVGIAVDVVAIDRGTIIDRWSKGDYDSIYFGVQSSSTDPALNPEFWLSSGAFHFWNPGQATPASEWEATIDELLHRQAAAETLSERQQLFAEVQRIFGEELPAIYFVAPKITVAVSTRVRNAQPVLQAPQILWNAETLAIAR